MFSVLQHALAGSTNRIRLTRRVFDSLSDFRAIADTLQARPTRFRELIPVGPPLALGACDASQRGMRGVWFMRDAPPIVWRAAFPLAIQRELITSSHHQGTLSISDLELSGTIAHKHILATAVPSVAERPV